MKSTFSLKFILFLFIILFQCLFIIVSAFDIPKLQKCAEKKDYFYINEKTVTNLSVVNEEMRNAIAIWDKLSVAANGFMLETTPPKKKRSLSIVFIADSITSFHLWKFVNQRYPLL